MRMPLQFFSIFVALVIGIAAMTLLNLAYFGNLNFLLTLFSQLRLKFLHPFGLERLTLTVAENQQPFISTWIGTYGHFFWLFILGGILLSYYIFAELDKKYRYGLTATFAFFIITLIFSRYKPDSILNGTSPPAQIAFFVGMLIIPIALIYVNITTFKKDRKNFEKFAEIDKALIFALIWFAWAAIGARGAIRLVFLLAPVVAFLGAFLIVKVAELTMKFKENVFKYGTLAIIVLVTIFLFYGFAAASAAATRNMFPHLHPQWTNAMDWVAQNTPENAVFGHWWDYGYWLQTGGKRATSLDGGNVYPYWDHLMGRYMLTNSNLTEALEFLRSYNITHYLIDSSDIGKYPAYSLIGSNESFDRYSWIPTFVTDENAVQETRNGSLYIYQGGSVLDEDFVWQGELFAAERVGIVGFLLSVTESDNVVNFGKPTIVFVKDGQRIDLPLNCIWVEGRLYEFNGEGIDGCLRLVPKVQQDGRISNFGSAFYLSPRVRRGLMARLYLLEENNPYFKLVHVEDDLVVAEIKKQLGDIPSIIDFSGLRAPIKIWEINYPENIKPNAKYLETNYPNPALSESGGRY